MDYWQWIINAINVGGAGAYIYVVWKNTQLRKLWREEVEQAQRDRMFFMQAITHIFNAQISKRND